MVLKKLTVKLKLEFIKNFHHFFPGGSSWFRKILIIFSAACLCALLFAYLIWYWRKNNFKIPDKLSTLYVFKRPPSSNLNSKINSSSQENRNNSCKNISKKSISSGMLLSSTNPTLLSKSTDLCSVERS